MFVFFVFLYVSPHKSKLDIYNILLALPHPGPPYLGGLPVETVDQKSFGQSMVVELVPLKGGWDRWLIVHPPNWQDFYITYIPSGKLT